MPPLPPHKAVVSTSIKARLGLLAVAVFASMYVGSCRGRGATGGCSGADSLCGGNPVGLWQVTGVCTFPVVAKPTQDYDTSRGYFAPETGAAPPATTSGSWCWDLSFDKNGNVATPATPTPNPDYVVSGTVEFKADHTYVYTLTAVSMPTKFSVARSCFGVNGANVTCADLATKLTASGIGVNPTYANLAGTPAFRCADAPDGDGCDCEFDYVETAQNAVGDKGSWQQDGNVIHHYSISGQGNLFETSPSRRTVRDATFCQNGDTMELTGANGQPIALKLGTRSLTLQRVSESDAGAAAGAGGGAAGENGGAAGAGGGPADAGDATGDGATD